MGVVSYTKVISLTVLFLIVAALIGLTFYSCRIEQGVGDESWNSSVKDYRHDLVVGRNTVHYIDIGQGQPIVLIHGFADSTYCWQTQYQSLLEAGYRLIMVEQPGLGRSTIPLDPYTYSIENQAAGVKDVIDSLAIENFHLIGHSMGGGISLYLTVHHPGIVRSMTLIDPTCFRIPRHKLLGIPGVTTFMKVFKGSWIVRKGLRDVFYDENKITENMVIEYSRPLAKKKYVKVLRSLVDEYFSPEFDMMTKRYNEIACPALILWGEFDPWIPPDFGSKLLPMIENSKLVTITDAGHNPHQEQPEQTSHHILSFLKDVDFVPDQPTISRVNTHAAL